jgi:hypothetical protein
MVSRFDLSSQPHVAAYVRSQSDAGSMEEGATLAVLPERDRQGEACDAATTHRNPLANHVWGGTAPRRGPIFFVHVPTSEKYGGIWADVNYYAAHCLALLESWHKKPPNTLVKHAEAWQAEHGLTTTP